MIARDIKIRGVRVFNSPPAYAPGRLYLIAMNGDKQVYVTLGKVLGGFIIQPLYPHGYNPQPPEIIPAHSWVKRVKAEIAYLPPDFRRSMANIPKGFKNYTGPKDGLGLLAKE